MNKLVPTVLYEDPDVVVIDKPAGLMVHPAKPSQDDGRPAHEEDALRDGKSKEPTLIDWILEHYPEMKEVGEPLLVGDETIARPGVVHRLDKDTSGVLILARTVKAHAYLKDQFMEREVHKVYRVFVYQKISEDRGTIDRPIGKSRTDFRQWSAARNPRGTMREARTDFRVIMRSGEATYLEVFPHTGRTHQIRVHMKAIQHPVICDTLYAAGKPALLGFTRLALHALSLRLTLPSGKEETFTAPLPPDFLAAEQELKDSAL